WLQVGDYDNSGMLRQNTQPGRGIPHLVRELHDAGLSNAAASEECADGRYRRKVDRVAHILAQQPLTALQTPLNAGNANRSPLFDSSWLNKKVTTQALRTKNWQIVLKPGVAFGLAYASSLLRPAIQLLWMWDVARFNRGRLDMMDLAEVLFPSDR